MVPIKFNDPRRPKLGMHSLHCALQNYQSVKFAKPLDWKVFTWEWKVCKIMGVEGLPNHQHNKCFILIDNIITKRQHTLYFKENFTILYIFFYIFSFYCFYSLFVHYINLIYDSSVFLIYDLLSCLLCWKCRFILSFNLIM